MEDFGTGPAPDPDGCGASSELQPQRMFLVQARAIRLHYPPSHSMWVSCILPTIPFYSPDVPFIPLPLSKQRMLVLGILWVLGDPLPAANSIVRSAGRVMKLLRTAQQRPNPDHWAQAKISETPWGVFPTAELVSHVKIQLTCFQTICNFNC